MSYLEGIYQDPGAVLQNTIQPVTDTVVALNLKRHSAGQTAAHLQWGDETGAVQGRIDPSGTAFLLSTAVGAPVMPGATSAANMIWGVSQAGYADTTCADEYITRVASDKTFLANLVMSVNNPVAPVPTRALMTWGIAGVYPDSGTLDPTTAIFFNNSQTGQTFLAIESVGSNNSRVALGLGAVSGVWDGQLDVQPMISTQKGLTLTAAAGQTANMMEVKDSSLALQVAIAPNGRDFVLDTTTGTKWGTAVGQKQGWYGAMPVVQQANASAAGVSGIAAGALYAQADMVAVKAALTAIRAALAANGLLANTA